jgi:hypothetical protein
MSQIIESLLFMAFSKSLFSMLFIELVEKKGKNRKKLFSTQRFRKRTFVLYADILFNISSLNWCVTQINKISGLRTNPKLK